MTRVACAEEAQGTPTWMARFADGPSESNSFDFRVGVLGFGPAPSDRASDAIERRKEIDITDTVLGQAEDAPFRRNGDARENGWFESSEERVSAETGNFAVDENSPLL